MNQEINTETTPPDLSEPGAWKQLPQESSKSYALFVRYLELGPDTTLHQLAEESGRTFSSVANLSSLHNWLERAAAYRQHQANKLLVASQNYRAKQTELCQARDIVMRQQMWETAQTIAQACRHSLNQFLADPKVRIEPYELARFIDLFHKLAARANAPTGFTSNGPAPVNQEWEEVVEKIYGKPFSMEEFTELFKLSSAPKPAPTTSPTGTGTSSPPKPAAQ